MKIDKLKIGQIYYLSSCSRHSYKKVTLLEIVDSEHVLLRDKKNRIFIGRNSRLHKTPDKAVDGLKHREAIRREMKTERQGYYKIS